mmetsp:Transcript_7599/g.16556  ORF Transcript_7599/g.16556 Transcript_7599/m.16556 type:complete len:182 (-) Transcript_7599:122-667(-)
MVFRILQIVADSTPLLTVAALLEAVSVGVMFQKIGYLKDTFGVGEPPDTWFGISPDKFYDYLNKLGPDGCQAYGRVNSWDFFPYMPAYMILLGAMLLLQCRSAGISLNISWLFPVAMFFDIIESSIFGYATRQFPEHLSNMLINVASIANQIKWASFLFGLVALVGLFANNSMRRTKSHHQ